jgi:phosphopantothenoylcysteine synthetase/decarboxylase
MKKSILLSAAFALFATFSFAGDDVPAAVKSKFASLYPNVKKAKWDKEAANYEAEFEVNEVETSVLFDATGNLLETETEIAVTALPKAVSDYVTKNYATEKIKEASKIVDSKGTVTYEAEVKSGDLIFDAQGNFIKKEVDQNNDKDKD